MIDLSHAELHFRQPAGHEVGGFVVGRLAKMNRNPNTAVIVGVQGKDGRTQVTLQFAHPQPVDVPEGAMSTCFDVDSRSVSCTWLAPAIQAYERPNALKGQPLARRGWKEASTSTCNGWNLITAELHRVALLKGDDLVFFALEEANFDNPILLADHEYQLALAEATRWANAHSSLRQAA